MRLAPLGQAIGTLLDFGGSNDGTLYNKFTPGCYLDAAPTDGLDTTANVPNWGQCELLYVRYTGAAVLNPGRLVTIDHTHAISDLANTANLGQSFYVTLTRFAIGNVTTQYGWVMVSGIAPVQFAVAATTGALFIGGAGQATPTAAAGKQLLNARTLVAAVSTFTRTIQTQNGSPLVRLSRCNGLYVGQAISGTGIPASSVISSLDPSGQALTIGSAIGTPVNATASGSVTGTFTNTNYGIVQFNRGFAQGQIT